MGKSCCDNCKKGKECCSNKSMKEKISKDEWAQYPKYARKLKPYLQKLFKVPIRVRVIKQANHNPWIEVRVAKFGKDIIPNDFRVKAAKAIGASGVRDWDNVNYGNIRVNSISLKTDVWRKLLGNKVKESVNERISVFDERHFGKKGIIIMIDDNGKKVSAIFKDKKNANKFNRNKLADIKKLLQLAKKTKYPKAIDESVNEGKKVVKAKTVKNKRHQNQSQVAQELIKKLKKRGWKVPQYLSDTSTLERQIINAYEKARKKWRSTMGNTVVFSVDDNKDFTDKNFKWVKESVNEAIKPQGYSQLNRSARTLPSDIKDFLKALKKQDDDAVEREILYLKAQFDTFAHMLKDKKYTESVNEATNYYKSKRKSDDLYYKKVGNKWYKSLASKKGKVKWYVVKFPQDLDKRDMSKINKNKLPSGLNEAKNEVKPMKLTKSKLREIIREEIQKLNEGFGSPELMGEKDLAKFEKTRQKNAEVLGYKLTGRVDHNHERKIRTEMGNAGNTKKSKKTG